MAPQQQDPVIGMARLTATQAIAARKLLLVTRDPKEYTMNGKAEDADGNQVSPLDPKARKWSLLGSFYRARLTQEEAVAAKLMFEMPNFPIASVSFGIRWVEMRNILKQFKKNAGLKKQLYFDYCALAVKMPASASSTPAPGDVNAEAQEEHRAGPALSGGAEPTA